MHQQLNQQLGHALFVMQSFASILVLVHCLNIDAVMQRLGAVSHEIMTSIVVHGGTQQLLGLVQAGVVKVPSAVASKLCLFLCGGTALMSSITHSQHFSSKVISTLHQLKDAHRENHQDAYRSCTPFIKMTLTPTFRWYGSLQYNAAPYGSPNHSLC